MGQVISAGILLVVVVAIYIAVSYRHYGNTARNRLEGTGRGEEAAGRDAGKQGQALCGEHDPEGGTSGANTSLSGGRTWSFRFSTPVTIKKNAGSGL